jgi:predicted oxidoreductase
VRTYAIPRTDLELSRLAYGCMNLGGAWDSSPLTGREKTAAIEAVATAHDAGITLFDHADIYARGKSEAVFADALDALPDLRDQIVLQSKCGIRFADDPSPGDPGRYDFSHDHIVASVEGSLRRLRTDRLDVLLLHRPDPLVEPDEVARAFDALHASGKVRWFGVSNHTTVQMELLARTVDQPLVINQLELSLLHCHLVDEGILANQSAGTNARATGLLDHCRLNGVLVQAWSPLARGRLFATPVDASPVIRETAGLVTRLAAAKRTSKEAIVLAWLLRHPAGIQPVVGTTTPARIRASCEADSVELSREEWYALFTAARGERVP